MGKWSSPRDGGGESTTVVGVALVVVVVVAAVVEGCDDGRTVGSCGSEEAVTVCPRFLCFLPFFLFLFRFLLWLGTAEVAPISKSGDNQPFHSPGNVGVVVPPQNE